MNKLTTNPVHPGPDFPDYPLGFCSHHHNTKTVVQRFLGPGAQSVFLFLQISWWTPFREMILSYASPTRFGEGVETHQNLCL